MLKLTIWQQIRRIENMNKIIDISDYQRGANLEAAYSNDIKGFIFRAGWGNDDPDQDDKVFEDFVSQAERIGAPWGAYLFSYATCAEDVKSEIAHMKRLLAERKPELGVWWDVENSDYKEQRGFNDFEHAATVKVWADEFITAMQDAGLTGGVYCNLNYAKNIDFSGIEHIWIAGYFDSPDLDKPPCKCDIWQYSSQAAVAGIAGNVDINVVYADWINDIIEGNTHTDIAIEGGDVMKMNMTREQLKYEINRHALTLLGREIGDADKYVEFLTEGQIDWYEFDRRLQESEEGVKRWIKLTLFIDILGRIPEQSEIDWWYAQYCIHYEMNKALMVERFTEDYEKFKDEYISKQV